MMTENSWNTLLSVDEARSRILQVFSPLETETISIDRALNRVLAEEVVSPYDLPHFDNSSVDGFALRLDGDPGHSDTPLHFKVVGDIPAGTNPKFLLKPGQAARIMTGALVPAGSDRIAPVEWTDFPYRDAISKLPESIQLTQMPKPGENIRPRGQDIQTGSLIFAGKKQLSPADIGMLSMIGLKKVKVHRTPNVGLFSSGDELVKPGGRISKGKIFDSNSAMLKALLIEAGCHALPMGIARDHPDFVLDLFENARKNKVDLIITTAGVSVGAFDYVRKILEDNGKVEIWRVNMRPGKPVTFGFYQSIPVISLPGNPVSAYVSFLVFVLPVLRKMMGFEHLLPTTVHVRLEQHIESDGRESYLRAVVRNQNGEYTAALSGHQGSANLYSLTRANALLIVPSGVQSLPAGEQVQAWLLSDIQQLNNSL